MPTTFCSRQVDFSYLFRDSAGNVAEGRCYWRRAVRKTAPPGMEGCSQTCVLVRLRVQFDLQP